MLERLKKPTTSFIVGGAVVFIVVQLLLSLGLLNNYWRGIIFWGAAITMVTLGLNLIYGFNGQFSLGQYGFYAIGAYTSADVTWRWVHHDPSGMIVVLCGALLALALYALVTAILRRFYGVTVMARFTFYVLATILAFWIAVVVFVPLLTPVVGGVLGALPDVVSRQIVFFSALLGGAGLAGIAEPGGRRAQAPVAVEEAGADPGIGVVVLEAVGGSDRVGGAVE